jgi:hypothetical protein
MRLPDKPNRKGAVDAQIDEAIERGEFQNLKGKGRPLQQLGDLSKREEMRSKLRSDANFSAPWEEVGREIETQTRRVELELRRAGEFRRAGLDSTRADKARIEADFQAHLNRIEEQVKAVNSLILKHNLLLPSLLPHLYRRRLQLGELMAQLLPDIPLRKS